MKKQIYKFLAVLLACLALCWCCTVVSFAANDGLSSNSSDDVILRLSKIGNVNVEINFSSGNNMVIGTAVKQTTATTIEGTVTLYRYSGGSWVFVNSWSGSTARRTLTVTGTFSAVSGTQYKAVFTVTAYDSSGSESATETYYATCP